MTRALLLLVVVLGGAALAQADLPDAGLPDASVGGTGAERESPEEEDSQAVVCLSDRDCERGFGCINGRCSYRRFRDATFEGCGAAGGLGIFGAALWLARRRHFLAKTTK